MPKRGPPPLPDALRKLRGKRHRKKEDKSTKPTVTAGAPAMPAHLSRYPVASAAWLSLVKHLKKMHVLSPQDGAALEGLCMAYSHAVEADAYVRKEGLIIKRKGRAVGLNPVANMRTKLWREVRMFAQEFGLTPSSATRVRANSASSAEEAAQADAESFLFRGDKSRVIGGIGRGGRSQSKKDKPL